MWFEWLDWCLPSLGRCHSGKCSCLAGAATRTFEWPRQQLSNADAHGLNLMRTSTVRAVKVMGHGGCACVADEGVVLVPSTGCGRVFGGQGASRTRTFHWPWSRFCWVARVPGCAQRESGCAVVPSPFILRCFGGACRWLVSSLTACVQQMQKNRW
jgi:hypothetical protein